MPAYTEIEHLRTLELVGLDWWKGTRSLLTYSASVQGVMKSLHGTLFPGVSGDSAPTARRRKALFNPRGHKGKALMLVHYQTPRRVGKAQISFATTRTSPAGYSEAIMADLQGKIVQGPDPDGVHTWMVTRGAKLANNVPTPFARITVATAYPVAQYQLGIAQGRVGSVNSAALPNFYNAAAGTMLLLGAGVQHEYDDELVYIDYHFLWSGGSLTWNEIIQSQKGLWVVRQEPIFTRSATTGTYTDSGETKDTLVFQPAQQMYYNGSVFKMRTAKAETRTCFPLTNFSDLNSMISWKR